jgi:hypothetical protein
VRTEVLRGHADTVLEGSDTVANVKTYVPQKRYEEMDEGMDRWADRGRVEEHEIDVRGRVQLSTAIPPQGQQGTGGIDVKCFATDLCAAVVELTDHDVRQVCQSLYHLHAASALPVLLPDGPPLRLHKVPEKPEELLPLPHPVALSGKDSRQVDAAKKPLQGKSKSVRSFSGEQGDSDVVLAWRTRHFPSINREF